MYQFHADLTGKLNLSIAGLDLDAMKDVSSHTNPVSVTGTPGPAGRKSYKISWTVLRHCLHDHNAALLFEQARRSWTQECDLEVQRCISKLSLHKNKELRSVTAMMNRQPQRNSVAETLYWMSIFLNWLSASCARNRQD